MDALKKMGFAIVDLEGKNHHMRTLPYYSELYSEIKELSPTDAIVMCHEITNEIFETIGFLLVKSRKGARFKPMLDLLPKNMQDIITTIFDWFNPYLITDNVKEIVNRSKCW